MNQKNRSSRSFSRGFARAVVLYGVGLLAACGAEGQDVAVEAGEAALTASATTEAHAVTPSGASLVTEADRPTSGAGESAHCVAGWICQAECYDGISRWYNVGICPSIGWGECTGAAQGFCSRWGLAYKSARWLK